MTFRLGIVIAAAGVFFLALSNASANAFGFKPGQAGFEAEVLGEGGEMPATLAGSHPFAVRIAVDFELEPGSTPGAPVSDGDVRDIELKMPPGLIENPSVVAKCGQTAFHTPRSSPFGKSRSGESCPALSQIGTLEVRSSASGAQVRTFGLFNLDPPPGYPSQIGARPFGVSLVFAPTIRSADGGYGVTLGLRNVSQLIDINGLTLTIWGNPWGLSHNGERGNCLNEAEPTFPFAKCPIEPPAPEHSPQAYLTLPTSCTGPLVFEATATSWQGPSPVSATAVTRDLAGEPLGLSGCAGLRFEPSSHGLLTNNRASSPTGFDFRLTQEVEGLLNPRRQIPSQVRRAVVSLPEGVTINPSVGAGLGACAAGQFAAETAASPPGAGCPNDAKIGDFTVETSLFADRIEGAIYLARPDDRSTSAPGAENPFDSLLALYLVAKAPAQGVIVKVAGHLEANPTSGRLTAIFDRLPQLPYTDLEMHFREGQRAPLLAPPACGDYRIDIELGPWGGAAPSLRFSSPFTIARGIGAGESCPVPGPPPFAPRATGGMLNAQAGAYSPFHLRLTRRDSEQEITSYSATLPPGLTGKIAGVPYCSEGAIARAAVNTGTAEEQSPSCPQASLIGRTVAGYGASSVLAYASGRLYLAGPYNGSTFSVVAVNSAKVGPFDLGVIIVRSAIRIDRRTAQVSIDSAGSDPIPHIIDGIPIHLRDIRVYIDRPETTINPTSCDPMTLTSTLTGSGGRFSDPTDDISSTVSTPFQVSSCSSLGFSPRLGLRLRGGTRRGKHPALRATLKGNPRDGGIRHAQVTLPRSLFLEQGHIDTICTQVQFAADACPRGSIYGRAAAWTPLLANPLRGFVYLRSSGTTLPDIVMALRGDGVAIDLVGRVDSFRGGIRATFDKVPDAPVSRFVVQLYGGRRGILENATTDLCESPQRARVSFLSHSNAGVVSRPRVRPSCRKKTTGKRAGRGPR